MIINYRGLIVFVLQIVLVCFDLFYLGSGYISGYDIVSQLFIFWGRFVFVYRFILFINRFLVGYFKWFFGMIFEIDDYINRLKSFFIQMFLGVIFFVGKL